MEPDMPPRIWYIDNTHPSETRQLIFFDVVLPSLSMPKLLSFNPMDKVGTFSWLEANMIIYGWPLELGPRVWVLTNKSSDLINLASAYCKLRGTYVVQLAGGPSPTAKLSLISHTNDVTGLSV